METNWYILKVLPGKERSLCDSFNQQISLGRLTNIKRFVCPTEKEFVMVKKKKVLREKVIYSGYLYFETENRLTEDQLKEFTTIPNIMGILGDKTPVLLKKTDVARIIKDEVLEEHVGNLKLTLSIGDNVTIIDGPFTSFTGNVVKIDNERVDVLVKIFGRDTNVSLSLSQIKY